jgi:hypothetical protein
MDQTLVQAVLDELVRAAVDAGLGSRRCETIGETVATISSISLRGRIFAKLRKVSPSEQKAKHLLIVCAGVQ